LFISSSVIINSQNISPLKVGETSCPENLFQFESSVFAGKLSVHRVGHSLSFNKSFGSKKGEAKASPTLKYQVKMGQINYDISLNLSLMFFCFLITSRILLAR